MHWFAGWEAICQRDAPLAPLTWYRLGGPARWLFTPRDEHDLTALLACCERDGIPWRILGQGANVIVRDEGFAGAAIRLSAPTFQHVEIEGTTLRAGAGVSFPDLIKKHCLPHGLGGLESLAGIPGTVGGVIRMNAGGRFGEVGEFVRDIRVMDVAGRVHTLVAAEVGFAYRHTDLAGRVVLAATFALRQTPLAELRERYLEIFAKKAASQPPLGANTAGCIFKNPPGHAAGALIDQAGLKGTTRGGAVISHRHANFIETAAGARAQDVLELIDVARERVRQATGIELQLEVDVW